MKYQPNFSDPRAITRIKKAIGFACGVMSEIKPHPWSTRHIDKFFGKSNNPLSRYLRETLLICTDQYYRFNADDKNKCKEYILNANGVRILLEALKLDTTTIYPSVLQVARDDHMPELSSGNFQYLDKSNRLWHPLQRYRKHHRSQILANAGYLHDYDIECCAPTLIHQYAQQLGMDEYLFAINRYLKDRTQVREEIAKDMDLPVAAIKEIINALFAGAALSEHTDSDIYYILGGDISRIRYLKQHPFITELRDNIKLCWEYIRPTMEKRTKLQSNGRERLCKLTCKQKWNVYFELERVILNSVRTYLEDRSYKYFLMHDGWVCEREIDRDNLRDYVRDNTEFDIKFDYAKLDL